MFSYFWDIVIGILISLFGWYTTANAAAMGERFISLLVFLGGNEQNLFLSFRQRGGVYTLAVYIPPIFCCLLVMGRAAKDYLDEQKRKAGPELKEAIERVWQKILDEER